MQISGCTSSECPIGGLNPGLPAWKTDERRSGCNSHTPFFFSLNALNMLHGTAPQVLASCLLVL